MTQELGEPLPFSIERGKVAEFARAVHSRSTETPETIAPTFGILTMFLGGPEHSVRDDRRDIARILHAEQEFIFFGPPPVVGARLFAEQRRGPVWEKEGRRGGKLAFAQVDTIFRDSSGHVIMEARFITVTTSQATTTSAG
jgi:N-terminal half of MaoC dehydratase